MRGITKGPAMTDSLEQPSSMDENPIHSASGIRSRHRSLEKDVECLRKENARLRQLLMDHGIELDETVA